MARPLINGLQCTKWKWKTKMENEINEKKNNTTPSNSPKFQYYERNNKRELIVQDIWTRTETKKSEV